MSDINIEHLKQIAKSDSITAMRNGLLNAITELEKFRPDWANFREGFDAGASIMADEVKQLCKDFSDLRDRPYMGDVHAQVDALLDQVKKELK